VALIFHNLDKVNPELYDYASNLIMFKCNREPQLGKINNDEIEQKVIEGFKLINKLPDYHFLEIPLKGETKIIIHKPI
jgi:hypothetical protein